MRSPGVWRTRANVGPEDVAAVAQTLGIAWELGKTRVRSGRVRRWSLRPTLWTFEPFLTVRMSVVDRATPILLRLMKRMESYSHDR